MNHIYAIGDLHLPGRQDKPMDIFGPEWKDHQQNIAEQWRNTVGPDDVVLVPGDLSWALKLEEAVDDLRFLGRLPGKIVLSRGNHDYWWQAIGKVRRNLPPNVSAIQNDYVPFGKNGAICATRGWTLPGSESFTADDEKLIRRELQRLELSLNAAVKDGLHPSIVMLHYPPATKSLTTTEFTELLQSFRVQLCVYGHLHGEVARRNALIGTHRGIVYRLVAADAINFTPIRVASFDTRRFHIAPID